MYPVKTLQDLKHLRGKPVVYFVQMHDSPYVKIGMTGDFHDRVRSFLALSPINVRVLGIVEDGPYSESDIHVRFSELRTRGEWFRLDAEIAGFIEIHTIEHPFEINDGRFFRINPRCLEQEIPTPAARISVLEVRLEEIEDSLQTLQIELAIQKSKKTNELQSSTDLEQELIELFAQEQE